jgi:hypothetical protein
MGATARGVLKKGKVKLKVNEKIIIKAQIQCYGVYFRCPFHPVFKIGKR